MTFALGLLAPLLWRVRDMDDLSSVPVSGADGAASGVVSVDQVEDLLDMLAGLSLIDLFQLAILVVLAGLVFGLIVTRGWK